MRFAHPWMLFATAAVVAAVWVWVLARQRRSRRLLEVFGGEGASKASWADPGFVSWRVWAERILTVVTLGALGVTLARPMLFKRDERSELQGVPFIVALDASRSMLAPDIRPSRYGAATNALDRFFADTVADRIGLITFSGVAYLNSPLAYDMTSLRTILRYVQPEDYLDPGSAISGAIERAARYFMSNNIPQRVVVVISDGEDMEGRPVEVARRYFTEQRVKVATIGVGTASGAKVPLGRPGVSATNAFGQTVTTRLNESLLQRIANAAGGKYYRLGENGEGLKRLRQEFLAPLAETEARENLQNYREFYQIPLSIALISMVGLTGVSADRFRRPVAPTRIHSGPDRARAR